MTIFIIALVAGYAPYFLAALALLGLIALFARLVDYIRTVAYRTCLDYLEIRARVATVQQDNLMLAKTNELKLIAARRQTL